MNDKTRLRVFAGPNGSGKTTLFKAFTKRYDPGYFINADEYEQQLTKGGLIDLTTIGLKATQTDLDIFSLTTEAKSLLKKQNQRVVPLISRLEKILS
jgi:predicted ABC-type ATPase